jgi:cytochrome c-type biogenesis protein CcmE
VKAKNQRLVLAVIALTSVVGAGLMAATALDDKVSYFYSPADIAKAAPAPGEAIRLGGMVADKSIKRDKDGVTISFVVEDGGQTTPVRFRGIVPDLFKENSGVVAEGAMDANGTFIATNILAKHDENYKPPELARGKHKTETLQP